MSPELSRRLGEALGTRIVSVEDRDVIVTAAQRARDFEDLPVEVQRLVERIEQRERW